MTATPASKVVRTDKDSCCPIIRPRLSESAITATQIAANEHTRTYRGMRQCDEFTPWSAFFFLHPCVTICVSDFLPRRRRLFPIPSRGESHERQSEHKCAGRRRLQDHAAHHRKPVAATGFQ